VYNSVHEATNSDLTKRHGETEVFLEKKGFQLDFGGAPYA
jgi:hypothetical protein